MSESREGEPPPPVSLVERMRRNAIWCFAGGVALLALRFAARAPVIAYVAGGAIIALGVGWLLANNPDNRKSGIFIIVAGILMGLSRFPVTHIALFAGVALNIATIWLLVTGARNLVSYIIAQGKRYR